MKKPASKKPDMIELAPDAWARFERLTKSAAKVGYMPHDSKTPVVRRASNKKARKK